MWIVCLFKKKKNSIFAKPAQADQEAEPDFRWTTPPPSPITVTKVATAALERLWVSAFSQLTTSVLSLHLTLSRRTPPQNLRKALWRNGINAPGPQLDFEMLKRLALRGRAVSTTLGGGSGIPRGKVSVSAPLAVPTEPLAQRGCLEALRAPPGPHTASSVCPGGRSKGSL